MATMPTMTYALQLLFKFDAATVFGATESVPVDVNNNSDGVSVSFVATIL